MKTILLYRLACLLLVAVPFLSARASEPVELPVAINENGHLIVPVSVNGEGPFAFLLDTGAQSTAIFRRLAVELLLPQSRRRQIMVQGLAGADKRTYYDLERIALGPHQIPLRRAFVLENSVSGGPPLYGILGADVLLRYFVDVDPAAQRLRLHMPGKPLDLGGDGWATVPIRPVLGRLIRAEGQVDGVEIEVLIDTGAPVSAVSELAAGLIDPLEGRTGPSDLVLRGANGRTLATRALSEADIQVGGMAWPKSELVVADLPILESLGLADRPALILGTDLLFRHRFAIDYANRQLLFRK